MLEHHRAVYRYLASRLGMDAADDALAQTFADAWRARAKFTDDNEGGLEAWLIRVASYVVAAHRRTEQRWLQMKADTAREAARLASALDDPNERVEERVDANALLRRGRLAEAVVDLPRGEREPLLMFALDGRPYTEIAAVLGMPVGTVRSRISRARRRLAAYMERTGERT